jgi:hypothetical protein
MNLLASTQATVWHMLALESAINHPVVAPTSDAIQGRRPHTP